MNLFIEELAAHIISTWDHGLRNEGAREVRFILQSLGPAETLSLFETLHAHAGDEYGTEIGCFFRTAKGLVDDWKDAPGVAADAIQRLEDRGWVDMHDQLTKYRNMLAKDQGKTALVVVLVGLNHATDQGGLADFHVVDERRIARRLGPGFLPWVERIVERLGVSASANEIGQFDELLRTLSELRPLQLGRLASFLEPMIKEGNCYGLDDFRARVLKALPAWDIPPLLPDASGAIPTGKKFLQMLKDAESFISHVGYKTAAKQKRDLAKLQEAVEQPGFALPTRADGEAEFSDENDYVNSLREFIFRADPVARGRLLRVDALPLVKALQVKKPGPGGTPKETVKSFDDLSVIVFLRALWDALVQFQKSLPQGERIDETLGDMTITLVTLEHDHPDGDEDEDGDGDADDAARQLLDNLLGGLEDRFQEIAEDLSTRWERPIAITWQNAPEGLKVLAARGRRAPSLLFKISVADVEGDLRIEDEPYRWLLESTQPERVRHVCIEKTRRARKSLGAKGHRLLPAFCVGEVHLTALFYAADEEEANRLLASAMQDMELMDLLQGLTASDLNQPLREPLDSFIDCYWKWLDATLEQGYYKALLQYEPPLRQAYIRLCQQLLNPSLEGASDLLRRVYKAFLLVDDSTQPSDPYLAYCAAWGLTPAVLELSQAQTIFLRDYFPEALDELAEHGLKHGEQAFERLMSLARMQRPMTTLVKNAAGALTTKTRDLGLLHCIGEAPSGTKSLAVQTLLKEDDEETSEKMPRTSAEREIVHEVLKDYADLHDFAADGLRILAVNVGDLSLILLGVEKYLRDVRREHTGYPPFECHLMVYSDAASPLAMENRLARWREGVFESCKENERPLLLNVGYRYAPKDRVVDELHRERHRYDLAFLFHFLRADMDGHIETARPSTVDAAPDATSSLFPISEYPRPIQADQPAQREMLLSNRRLLLQTRHASLSARLRHPGDLAEHHLVLGRVNAAAWEPAVNELHAKAQWVACIDPFVDKQLINPTRPASTHQVDRERKIVGFASGLGDYGELNLTISSEHDALGRLVERVAGELRALLPHAPLAATNQETAMRIVEQAEHIAGLASLRAVLGNGEQIREVVGFGAVQRMLQPGEALISQLLPLDAMRSWMAEPGQDNEYRPDLLQLSLRAGKDGVAHIQATVIECKVAARNSVHVHKALQQVRSGLFQLSRVLAPRCKLFEGMSFDRRYWWAQLQRAIASRSQVSLSVDARANLNATLECVAEGHYDISWRGMIFTFWSDVADAVPEVIEHRPVEQLLPTSVEIPEGFFIEQVVLGYKGLIDLFASDETPESLKVEPSAPPICIRYNQTTESPSREIAPPEEMAPPGEETPVADEAQHANAEQNAEQDANAAQSADPDHHPQKDDQARHVQTPVADQARQEHPRVHPFDPQRVGAATTSADATPSEAQPPPSAPPLSTTGPEPSGAEAGAEAEAAERSRGETSPMADSRIGSARGSIEAPATVLLPERILIGTRPNGEPVYWYFGHPQLLNRHLLVFGNSGTGKTYGIQCLLAEMAVGGVRSLIVDYTDGFLPGQVEQRFKEIARPKDHFVYSEGLPLNPFRRQRLLLDPSQPMFEEDTYTVASRITSLFSSVYDIGEQQRAALSRALQKGLEGGLGFSFEALLPILRDDGSQGLSLANKIEPFVQARPFRTGSDSAWDSMLGAPDYGVHILQLKGRGREIQRLVTEFVLWDFWDYAQSVGNKDRPLPVVLDEIQNLDHRSDSPIDKMLREGRKFGLALILATQTTSNFNAEQRDRLFQAGHKLFFKPADTEIDRFSDILSKSTTGVSRQDWADRLARLEKGQCWSLGPALQANGAFKPVPLLVRVTALEQRFNGA